MINFIYDLEKNLTLKRNLYANKNRNFILNHQLEKLNKVWKDVTSQFIFYSTYKKKNHLPTQIKSLEDFSKFPIISKEDITKNYENILKDSKTNKNTFTGGTSGPVTKFPTGFIDSKRNFINQVYLRESYNILSKDKCLYIWGHSHKFSKNPFNRTYKELVKIFKNYYFNRLQFSAYDLSDKNINSIFNYLINFSPTYIITYASTFVSILNYLNNKNLKYMNTIKILLTSDNLSLEDFKLTKEVFPKSELINEFGMAETGVIGYNKTDNFYTIETLWDSFLIQSSKEDLILTDLNKRVFPLIRYSPDDKIDSNNDTSVLEFKISGKNRPLFKIRFKNKYEKISSIIFDHIFKFDKLIRSTQYYWDKKKLNLTMIFTCDFKIEKKYLYKKLYSHFGGIPENISIFITNDTIKTKAGKFIYHLTNEDLIKNKHKLS